MLAYVATKSQFLEDAPEIADIVRNAVARNLKVRLSIHSPEFKSWQNSLGNAMFHVLNTDKIPGNTGVAIEYRIHGRRQRIDVMLSGLDHDGIRSTVVVELKQWSEIHTSLLPDHVLTFLGQGQRDLPHPSYQAWSYSRLLTDFYEVVTTDPIRIHPCAFVHNCLDGSVLRDSSMSDLLSKAPVFLKGENAALRQFISAAVERGDDVAGLYRIDESPIAPSKQLVQALTSMLEGNEEFVLIDEQKTAFESIMARVQSVPLGKRWVFLIRGGPGTGKSVIAVNALVRLLQQGLNVRYVTKNAAPRAVYKAKLQRRSKEADFSSLFVSSDMFYNVEEDAYDVLLVDEAHRLVRNSGVYGNLGHNQIAEIMRAARVTVFFLDESQRVTWRDIGTVDEITAWASQLEAPLECLELSAQFRCAGSDEYLQWIDSLLNPDEHRVVDLTTTDYDIRVVDSPSELRDLVFEKNCSNNASRLLAGYCWDWVSKKDPAAYDIAFPGTDFAMRWNLTRDGSAWIIAPGSVNEIGCIHTCQGLEGDYMGVIIGPDLVAREGLLRTDPGGRARTDLSLRGWKKAAREDRESALARTDELIRNTYRTLLTRGMRGTFVYCTDRETGQFFRDQLAMARASAAHGG
jgi:DUF2075 family protein